MSVRRLRSLGWVAKVLILFALLLSINTLAAALIECTQANYFVDGRWWNCTQCYVWDLHAGWVPLGNPQ